jgi:hypothetical protein
MKARIFIAVIVFLSVTFLSTSAQGVIPLSTHSSEPSSVPASWLDASMDLSVADVGYWELTLTVTNMTPENTGDIGFNMSELYLNTNAPITSLTLDSVVDGSQALWDLTFDMDNILCDGFGMFDISLITKNTKNERIEPQETVTFKITIDGGTPPFSDTDFFDLSFQNDNHILSYGAAKFFGGGPQDLSAYGAYVPEPATIFMLGLGGLMLRRKRKNLK